MTGSISIKMIRNEQAVPALLISGYTIAAIAGLHHYMHLSANLLMGLIALATTWRKEGQTGRPVRFAWLALLFTILYLSVPARTLLFAAIACGLLFVAETFAGRISFLSLCALVFMSPIFEYLTNVFSFPIRIMLTALASGIMRFSGETMQAHGNTLVSNGTEFSVDPACMGLHMFGASLLAGLILIGIFQKKYARRLSATGAAIVFISIALLNIVGNLLRIICLVHFKIGPDMMMHQVMGLCCFAGYVLAPSIFITRRMVYRSPVQGSINFGEKMAFTGKTLQHVVLLTTICAATIINRDRTGSATLDCKPVYLTGYRSTSLGDHITKLEDGDALIYVKPITGFYSSDHQPTTCWIGSGYELKKVQEKQIGRLNVYAARLEKGKDILYTAWWYDNGTETTISQLQWRWQAFSQSRQYALMNVTAATGDTLEKEIIKFTRQLAAQQMTKR
jgi:exosortase N